MVKIKNNLSLLVVTGVIFCLTVLQISHMLWPAMPVDQLISKNYQSIEALFSVQPAPDMKYTFFNLKLPIGMQLYAVDRNNFKIRYEDTYFEVHLFSSNLKGLTYAQEIFKGAASYKLPPLRESEVALFVKDSENEYVTLGVYSEDVEIKMTVPRYRIETNVLKAAELLRNVQVDEVQQNQELYIGSTPEYNNNNGVNLNEERSGDGTDETGQNKSVPIM